MKNIKLKPKFTKVFARIKGETVSGYQSRVEDKYIFLCKEDSLDTGTYWSAWEVQHNDIKRLTNKAKTARGEVLRNAIFNLFLKDYDEVEITYTN